MSRRVPSRISLISGPFLAPIAGLLALVAVLALVVPVAAAPTLGPGGPLPLTFEPNVGQADASVKFLARGRGYGLFLTPNETVFVLVPILSPEARATMAPLLIEAEGQVKQAQEQLSIAKVQLDRAENLFRDRHVRRTPVTGLRPTPSG